jgi:hypothetical protein
MIAPHDEADIEMAGSRDSVRASKAGGLGERA